jgi:hypothetical protein
LTEVLKPFSSQPIPKIILNIIGIHGIEVAPWVNKASFAELTVSFVNSQIEFYINGTSINDLKCSNKLIPSYQIYPTIFNIFSKLIFQLDDKYPSQPICPYIFSNSRLLEMDIFHQIDAILVKNMVKFQLCNNNSNSNESINSHISTLQVSGYGFRLDTSLMHPFVFEHVFTLSIFKSIGSIQPDLFAHFNYIHFIEFQLDNLNNFFHKIGIAWTQNLSLAYKPRVAFSRKTEQDNNWIDGSWYAYPDTDFCLFAQFPLQPNLTYILVSDSLKECTSTIRWLISSYSGHHLTVS